MANEVRRVETILSLTDNYTAGIRRALAATDQAERATRSYQRQLREMESASRAASSAQQNTTNNYNTTIISVRAAAAATRDYSHVLRELEADLAALNRRGAEGSNLMDFLRQSWRSFGNALVYVNQGLELAGRLMRGVSNVAEFFDEQTKIRARVDYMNDGLQTTKQLQAQIFDAAQRARGSYTDLGMLVSKIGTNAKSAFGSTSEIIRFSEIIQKGYTAGGSNAQETRGSLIQLTQALGSGFLRGEEFNSISEQAPIITNVIAEQLGVANVGALKALASDGLITSQILKDAVLAGADDIEARFQSMPRTFGTTWQRIANIFVYEMGPAVQMVIEGLNSPVFIEAMVAVGQGAAYAALAIGWMFGAIQDLYEIWMELWPIIEPFAYALGGALIAVAIPAVIALTGALYAQLGVVIALITAWLIANWYILLIGAAIGLLVYAFLYMQDTVIQVAGYVGGTMAVLTAHIQNMVFGVMNNFIAFKHFFHNVWIDPVNAVKLLFADLAISIINQMGAAASGIEAIINSIPGIEIAVGGLVTGALGRAEGFKASVMESSPQLTSASPEETYDLVDYKAAFDLGQAGGQQLASTGLGWMNHGLASLTDMLPTGLTSGGISAGGMGNLPPGLSGPGGLGGGLKDVMGPGKEIGDIGTIKGDVNIADEDLKLLTELSEMKFVQNFVTLTPQVNTRIDTVNENADVEGILKKIEVQLLDALQSGAEGVYN